MRYVEEMIKANQAYPCFCTDEELDEMRRSAEAENPAARLHGAMPVRTAQPAAQQPLAST